MLATLAAAVILPKADFTDYVVLGRVGQGGRSIIQRDAVLAKLAEGWNEMPKEGDSVAWGQGAQEWRKAQANDQRELAIAAASGWAATEVNWDGKDPYILRCWGASQVWVNGLPYAGDSYSTGTLLLPVQLKKGRNVFLFKCRGPLRAERVIGARNGLNFGLESTLPSILLGVDSDTYMGSIAIYNGSDKPVEAPGWDPFRTGPSVVAPYGVRRAAFQIPTDQNSQFGLSLNGEKKMIPSEMKAKEIVHKKTFRSEIDGSIQYYGVNPSTNPTPGQAMILSPHGASVEAIGQAAAYGQKTWGTLIAPTNRRPYGFDWEDWGRIDAFEVLADAKKYYQPDESKIYLTGHSMGGHGTWILGNQFPDQFAAIGPAAGWINFWSYGGAIQIQNPDAIEQMLIKAANVSDPLLTINNYKPLGVYTLHGDADDTVPVKQPRDMHEKLKDIVVALSGHEEPGVGHWYDKTPDPGADCVDYPPMFDFFLRHRRKPAAEVREVDFATCSPGVTSKSHWAEIVMQDEIGKPSRVQLDLSPSLNTVSGTTENVRVLRLDVGHLSGPHLNVNIDGLSVIVSLAGTPVITLEKKDGKWMAPNWTSSKKNPERYGWFKSAFNHRFILVYGTAGNDEEDRANLGRALFDSQVWHYRANGDCDVVSDEELKKMDHKGRSVILYGNKSTVSGWTDLVKGDITVDRDAVKLGDKSWTGKDLGVLFCLPKPNEDKAMIGVVGYTGNAGMVLTSSWPYFLAGVHVPDVMVAKASMLADGSKSVLATGFWDEDWSLKNAQMVYR